jgi:phosphoribosylaminoimidazolecarboxamide formyltransferase / IMP cyclohydrolase
MEKLALISVSNKEGLIDFAKALVEKFNYSILSTGGTAKLLTENAIPVIEVSDHTEFPEMMQGRIKTLHPKIHGALLCRRDKSDHLAQAREHNIALIDLVVVNLYPFEQTIAQKDASLEQAIENIDIGGPSMLRSGAKNHTSVTVVCDPADYTQVIKTLGSNKSELASLRKQLAMKVFQRTASYDKAITTYLEKQQISPQDKTTNSTAETFLSQYFQVQTLPKKTLRYGENPHQQAILYGHFFDYFQQIQGKQLSYNNILDITAASRLINEFKKPTVAILKHNNPCGVASDLCLTKAWDQALATDKQAPFGGIIVTNRTIQPDLANKIKDIFCEVIIAPAFSPSTLQIFSKKKNLRLIIAKERQPNQNEQEVRSVIKGLLVQDYDNRTITAEQCKVVTKRHPSSREWDALLFAWRVVNHVKSNAIVYASAERTLGIGAGQMSRIDSTKFALMKAKKAGFTLEESVVGSDAFFPFSDGLITAAQAGTTAVIQSGGSIRDEQVIETADKCGMAMVFTGIRHFRH